MIVGLGNYGKGLTEYLLRRNKKVMGMDFDPAALEKWRARGVPVVYGDMTDPEIHAHLPLKNVRWVVSTVRSQEMSMTFLAQLKTVGYSGKIALTATNDDEARAYEHAGVHLVFRPFADATEQAADALTYAMDFLPHTLQWPISFLDVRVRTDSSAAGKIVRDIPLRAVAGVSILAVSRAGRVHFEPNPDFIVFPGDRLLLMGSASNLKDAEQIINAMESTKEASSENHFEHVEVEVSEKSELSGKTIAAIRFRQTFGVTLVGIRRGEIQITEIHPEDVIYGGDRLIVIGTQEAISTIKLRAPV